MKLKTICLLVLLSAGQAVAFAQPVIRVLDKTNDRPVAYAAVYYPDTKTGTLTDSLGQFRIDFATPQISVQITALGYQTFLQTVDTHRNGQILYLQPSTHQIQEVVVTGNTSHLQNENVMNVEKLDLKNEDIPGLSLAQKLTSIAGLDNWSTGAGIGKPVIRGLSGTRVAVFSQGIRVENQQWGDEHGLGLDENGYEQVEIIKGPASLLYGNNALGGVLYFVDERYAKNNSIEAAVSSEFDSNTTGWRNNGTFKISKGRWHWNLFGGYTTDKDYKDGDNTRVANSRFNTGNLKTSLEYSGKKSITQLKYSYLHEKYGLTELDAFEGVAIDNGRQLLMPYQDLSTHIVGLENTTFFDGGSKLDINLGYVFNNRKEFEDEQLGGGIPAPAGQTAGLNMNLSTFSYDAKWNSPRWGRWALTAGSQGTAQLNTNLGTEILVPDANTYDVGLFAMSDCYYGQHGAYWQAGVRFDEQYITGDVYHNSWSSFNFSTGIYQPVTDNLSFRANLSSGFRAPEMYELLIDGVHDGTNRYEKGDTALKTENSYQIDLSLNYSVKHFDFFINPYFNYIRNYIDVEPTGQWYDEQNQTLSPQQTPGAFPAYAYLQHDAYLFGGEAGFHLHPHPLDWLHIEGSYSGTFGQTTSHDDLALMPAQKINALVSANFSFNKALRKFSVYVQNQYAFAQNRVSAYETTTPGYNLLNAGLVFNFSFKKQPVELNISANNLLNKTYFDHLSRYKVDGINDMGRNINVKITVPLNFGL